MVRRAATAIALALVALLAGCATVPTSSATHPRSAATDQVVTFAAVGDSLSGGCVPFPGTAPDACSWIFTTDDDPRLHYVGGWVQRGATSTVIADSVRPVEADFLVILAGTNNVLTGVPLEQLEVDFDSIADTVDPHQVVLLAIPPIDFKADTTAVRDTNAFLKLLAQDRGWRYFNPWSEYRDTNDRWKADLAPDGIHPIDRVQTEIGNRIAGYLDGIAD